MEPTPFHKNVLFSSEICCLFGNIKIRFCVLNFCFGLFSFSAIPQLTSLAKVQLICFCDCLQTGLRLLEWNSNLVWFDAFKGCERHSWDTRFLQDLDPDFFIKSGLSFGYLQTRQIVMSAPFDVLVTAAL